MVLETSEIKNVDVIRSRSTLLRLEKSPTPSGKTNPPGPPIQCENSVNPPEVQCIN